LPKNSRGVSGNFVDNISFFVKKPIKNPKLNFKFVSNAYKNPVASLG